jgi:hypothetical protein
VRLSLVADLIHLFQAGGMKVRAKKVFRPRKRDARAESIGSDPIFAAHKDSNSGLYRAFRKERRGSAVSGAALFSFEGRAVRIPALRRHKDRIPRFVRNQEGREAPIDEDFCFPARKAGSGRKCIRTYTSFARGEPDAAGGQKDH